MHSGNWWKAAPRIVAESLVEVPDPLLTVLQPGPPAAPRTVAASLAWSLSPEEDPRPAPSWLFPEQVRSYRRALAAVSRYAGAILADPVGTGKTYVALAVARALNQKVTACVVPATLTEQWQQVAKRLGVPVAVTSHELVSRGRLPRHTSGLVLVDESHRFRNPDTRRYAHLAAWLVGRPALLITATPVVNQPSDLAHQLLLSVSDDVLMLNGITSLRQHLEQEEVSPELGLLIVESDGATSRRPKGRYRVSNATEAENTVASGILAGLGTLKLSQAPSTAELLRGVLTRAAGSSPAALEGVLRRYRSLLLHARDAQVAGHPHNRIELRRILGVQGDQLVLWELLQAGDGKSDIALDDLDPLDKLIQGFAENGREDRKLCRLRQLLSDGLPTLVFATSRDTVRYLRNHLLDFRPAWCTGERAGIGRTVMPRAQVLSWFRVDHGSALAPRHLIVTDVAAEGLDLQRAARVVHYDLPWTSMRLAQREGRSIRRGSEHEIVEVVRFVPPPVLERALRLQRILSRKARLPARVGLGSEGRHLWRWRSALADRYGQEATTSGVARVSDRTEGLLGGFALHQPGSPERRLSSTVVWVNADGSWTESATIVAEKLSQAFCAEQILPVTASDQDRWLPCLAKLIRERMALTQGRGWLAPEPPAAARRLATTLQELIGKAARLRRLDRLAQLDRAMELVSRGRTAGEELMVERLAELSPQELTRTISSLPPRRASPAGLEVRLTGLIVFG
jgi:superfamily II DNA or RNA helicase